MKTPNTFSDYIKAKKKKKYVILFSQLLILVSFFTLWEVLAHVGFLNEFLVSKPSSIINLLITYISENALFEHVYISVIETLIGLVLGSLIGVLIAIILFFSNTLYKILEPYLTVLNALPKTALAPILIIWAGTNMKGIILVSVSLSIVITIISCYTYFVSTDLGHIKMMKSLGASKTQILTKLVLPSNIANLLSIFKINIGLSWIGVIVGEFLVSRNGIGYLLMYGGMVFRLDLVMMGVLILALIAFIMYEICNIIEKQFRKKKKHRGK